MSVGSSSMVSDAEGNLLEMILEFIEDNFDMKREVSFSLKRKFLSSLKRKDLMC